MIKRTVYWVSVAMIVYNLGRALEVVRDFFPKGIFPEKEIDAEQIVFRLGVACFYVIVLASLDFWFETVFHIDPRSERKFVWWLIAIATVAATAAAVILTVWEPVYSVAMDIGYWWPVYSVALFGLWAVTHHLRHWRTA